MGVRSHVDPAKRKQAAPSRGSEAAENALDLQQAIGNRAFARVLQRWGPPRPAAKETTSYICTVQGSADGPSWLRQKKTFPIESFSWGSVGGINAGKSPVGAEADFSFLKRLDKMSPPLHEATAKGMQLKSVEVVMRKGQSRLTLRFKDVLPLSFQSVEDEEPLDSFAMRGDLESFSSS